MSHDDQGQLEKEHDALNEKLNKFYFEFYDKVSQLDDIFVEIVAAKNGYMRCLQEQCAIKCRMVEAETAWVARRRMEMLKLPDPEIKSDGAPSVGC